MFRSLSMALDEVASVEPDALDDDELTAAVLELDRMERRLAAERARLTGAWDRRRLWALDGFRSGASWLAHRCRTPMARARALSAHGRRLRTMPRVAAAFAAGLVNEHHVMLLGRACKPHLAEAFERDEAMLVGFACELPMPEFTRAVCYWEQCADPDGTERRAADDHDARRAHLSELLDGIQVLDAQFDAVGGAIFADTLEGIETEMFEADWAAAKAEWGAEVSADELARTPAQRRLDALVEMARRARTAPTGGQAPRPLFTVLVGWETFRGRICQLANGTVVTPGQLAPFLSDADIERVVFDTPARVIEVGRRTRLFTGALRRAIEVRDQFCTQPGCNRPAARCEVDHLEAFVDGGETTESNGDLRCGRHNRLRQKGFLVERSRDGTFVHRRPDGRLIE